MTSRLVFVLILSLCAVTAHAQQSLEDSLLNVIAEYKDESAVAGAYNALAVEFSRKNISRSREYLNKAIVIGKKINNPKRLSSSYTMLVTICYNAGRPDSSEYYISLVKALADQAPEPEKSILYQNYYSTSALYYKLTGAFEKSIPFYEKLIPQLEKTGTREATAGQILNFGNTYQALGNYQQATKQHLKALRIFEELGNKRGISFCYQGLSTDLSEIKQYKQALAYSNKSLKIKIELDDKRGIQSAYHGMGEIYLGMGDPDKALSSFNQSLKYAIEMKQLPAEQNVYSVLRGHMLSKDDKPAAIEYYRRSRTLAVQLKDSSSVASIESTLIALQTGNKTTDSTEHELVKNLQLLEVRGDLVRKAANYKIMSDFYARDKQFEKALEFNTRYYEATDSIRSNDLQLQMKKMEEEYNSEKKEKEIELFRKEKEIQDQKLFRFRAMLAAAVVVLAISVFSLMLFINRNRLRQRMKELELRTQIAADLHDEVGSSLSSIHMLTNMATQQSSEHTHREILARMNSNVKETMDRMGDIVWTIKPDVAEPDNLRNRLERFGYEICSSKNITVEMNVAVLDKAKLSMTQRKNIYLIFKEALNNAVKYSGTESISIVAALENRKLDLRIKDEGNGFNPAIASNGNGLKNMKQRANDLGGHLTIVSATGEGTEVILTITT